VTRVIRLSIRLKSSAISRPQGRFESDALCYRGIRFAGSFIGGIWTLREVLSDSPLTTHQTWVYICTLYHIYFWAHCGQDLYRSNSVRRRFCAIGVGCLLRLGEPVILGEGLIPENTFLISQHIASQHKSRLPIRVELDPVEVQPQLINPVRNASKVSCGSVK
jgi:hypothetical protein